MMPETPEMIHLCHGAPTTHCGLVDVPTTSVYEDATCLDCKFLDYEGPSTFTPIDWRAQVNLQQFREEATARISQTSERLLARRKQLRDALKDHGIPEDRLPDFGKY